MEGYKNDMMSKNDENLVDLDQRVSIKIKKKQIEMIYNI